MRPVPGVFGPQSLLLAPGQTTVAVVVRGLPSVVVEGQFYDSRGKPCSGHAPTLSGNFGGRSYDWGYWPNIFNTEGKIEHGKFVLQAPKGLHGTTLDLWTNEHGGLRVRMKKDGPLLNRTRDIDLGTLAADVRGIEVVRYEAPILLVRPVDENGNLLKDAKLRFDYGQGRNLMEEVGRFVEGHDVTYERQADGRLRSEQLLPDEEFTVAVSAAGCQSKSETLKLPEGAVKELDVTLKPAAPKANDPTGKPSAAKRAIDLLREFKEEKTFWKQSDIARKLIAAGDKRVVPEIVPILASADRHVRCNAAWVLAGLGDERGLPAVLAELKDTSDRPTGPERIRNDGTRYVAGQIVADHYYAAWVLEKIGDRRAVPALIEALQDPDINYEAACALAHLGDQRAVPALLAALERAKGGPPTSVNGDNGDMRYWAGYALMGLGHPEGEKILLEIFKDGHLILRSYASEAFVEFPDKAAVPLLIRATADKNAESAPPELLRLHREIRGNAIVALGKIGDEAALPTLRALLADGGKEEVVARLRMDPPLFKTLTVREAAAQAIEEINHRREGVGNPSHGKQGETVLGQRPRGDCSISGKLVSAATGQPVDHAAMYLFYELTYAAMFVHTASDGTFTFKDIPRGPFSLQSSHVHGYQDVVYDPQGKSGQFPQFSLADGEHRAGIVLKALPACRVSGKLLDEKGKIPKNVGTWEVYAWFKSKDGKKYEGQNVGVEADGSYAIDGLDGKPVYVMAINPRAAKEGNASPPVYYPGTFSRSDAKLITFDREQRIENINITLHREGGLTLQGTVRDEGGKPVPEAFVVASRRDMLFDFVTAYSDEQGRYRIQGLGDGQFLVHVDAMHRGLVRMRAPVDLEKTSKNTRRNFTLHRGVLISGKLVDEKDNAWQIGRSYGLAGIVKDEYDKHWPDDYPAFSSTSFRNKYRPQDAEERSGGDFLRGEGDYDGGKMLFPTKSTFVIQGMMPGHTMLSFSPMKEGQKVVKILRDGRDIMQSGLDTKPGEEIKDITIVIGGTATR